MTRRPPDSEGEGMLCYGRKLLSNQEKIVRKESLILLITKGQCLLVPTWHPPHGAPITGT